MAAAVMPSPTAQELHDPSSAGRINSSSINNSATSPYPANSRLAVSAASILSSSRWFGNGGDNSDVSTSSDFLPYIVDAKAMSANVRTSTITSPHTTNSHSGDGKRRRRKGSKSAIFASEGRSETFPSLPAASKSTSTPKIRPYTYLRKMSNATSKEDLDQGRLDLSKPVAENDGLSGLGIQDFGTRTSTDAAFAPKTRSTHARTISGGSHVSVGSTSASFRQNQPFVHPMRQVPRPFTPATVATSHASSGDSDEEAALERDDQVDDFGCNPGVRSGRSQSISSTAAFPQLASVNTAPDLAYSSRAMGSVANASQTNLSIHSARSSRSRLGRSRRNTNRSIDAGTVDTTISRTSLDKTFSFTNRRSTGGGDLHRDTGRETPLLMREERIQAARRAFEEKEAQKDQQAARRRATAKAKSTNKNGKTRGESSSLSSTSTRLPLTAGTGTGAASVRNKPSTASLPASVSGRRKLTKPNQTSSGTAARQSGGVRARAYDDATPASPPLAAERIHRTAAYDEKLPTMTAGEERRRRAKDPQTSWARFSTWAQTRMLSCWS